MKLYKIMLLPILSTVLISCGGSKNKTTSTSENIDSGSEQLSDEEEITVRDYIDVLSATKTAMKTKVDKITMTKTEQIDDNGEMDENTFIYAIDRSSNKAYSVSGNSVDLFAPNAYEGHNVNYTTELKSGGDYSVWANYCGLGDIDDCDPVSDLNHLLFFTDLNIYNHLDDYFEFLLPNTLLEYGVFAEEDEYLEFDYVTNHSLEGEILESGLLSLVMESSITATNKTKSTRKIIYEQNVTVLFSTTFITSIEFNTTFENSQSALLKYRYVYESNLNFSRTFDSEKYDQYLANASSMNPWGGEILLKFTHDETQLTLNYDYKKLDTYVSVDSLISELNSKLDSSSHYQVTSITLKDGAVENGNQILLNKSSWVYFDFDFEVNEGWSYVCQAYEEPFEYYFISEAQEEAFNSLAPIFFEKEYELESEFVLSGATYDLEYTYDGYRYQSATINGEPVSASSFSLASKGQYRIVYSTPVEVK